MSETQQERRIPLPNRSKRLAWTAFFLYVLTMSVGEILYVLFGVKDPGLNLLHLPDTGWVKASVQLLSFGTSFIFFPRLFHKSVSEIMFSRFPIWNLYLVLVGVGFWLLQSLYLNMRGG